MAGPSSHYNFEEDYMTCKSDDTFHSTHSIPRTSRFAHPDVFEKNRSRIPGRCYLMGLHGDMQAGKSLKTSMLIASIFEDKEKNLENLEKKTENSILVIYITQSSSVDAVNQVIANIVEIEEVTKNVEKENIVTSEEMVDGKIDSSKNAIIVAFHDSRKEKKIIDYYSKTIEKWSDVFVVIDEIDQGDLPGLDKRISFSKTLYDMAMPYNVAFRILTITASIANLINLMSHQQTVFKTNRLNDEIGLNKKKFDLYFVKPSEDYVGVKYFIQNTRFIDLIMPEKKEFKTAKAYNEAVRETFYTMIEDIKPENKKYALISPSFYQNDHDACAMKMLEIGFNAAIKWNAANLKGYDAYYIGENGEVKSWFIPTQKIEKDADIGKLKILEIPTINARGRYVTERIETGINSSKNISPVEYIQSIFSEDIPSDHPKVNKFRKLALAMNIPEDFPEVLKLALVGGTKFDRGANFQEPSTYLAPTLYALMNKTSNTQRGAVISQKVGRMFGNTKKVYEKYGTMPLILTTKEIFEAVVANDLCLDDIRDVYNMYEKKDMTKNIKAKYNLIDNQDWYNYEKKAKKGVKKLIEAYEFLQKQAQAEEEEVEEEVEEDEEEEEMQKIKTYIGKWEDELKKENPNKISLIYRCVKTRNIVSKERIIQILTDTGSISPGLYYSYLTRYDKTTNKFMGLVFKKSSDNGSIVFTENALKVVNQL